MRMPHQAWLAAPAALSSGGALACTFPSYNLPIPFQMYAVGAIAALAASFLLVGYLVKAQPVLNAGTTTVLLGRSPSPNAPSVARPLVRSLELLSVGGLILTIATGIYGSQIPIANFNITFFFVVFMLGFAYATAVIGDVYQFINPWQAICRWIEYWAPGALKGQYRYPRRLAYYPALLLYMAYIWTELFSDIAPRDFSLILV